MEQHMHQKELISGFVKQNMEIFDNSEQAVYVYLDDINKACNRKFAIMLGYKSPEEWAKVEEPFPQVFVGEDSRHALVNAYQMAMENKAGSSFDVTWKTKSGRSLDTNMILVPICFNGHIFALHFIS